MSIFSKRKPVNLTRNDVSDSDDLSNGRFGIWKAGFLMFKQNILFGVGPSREGIVSYAKAFLPETYVAKQVYLFIVLLFIRLLARELLDLSPSFLSI